MKSSLLPSLAKAVQYSLAVYGVLVLALLLLAFHLFLPAEDAVILHQYSRDLAEHGAITYYAGGPHAEGATDFAWMTLLAAAMRLGLAPALFTSMVNVLCLPAVAVVLLRLAGERPTAVRVLAVTGAAGLLPQIVAAGAGFAVLPDALLLALLVRAVLAEQVGRAAALALMLCLFRPDGVVFAIPLLGSLLLSAATRGRRCAAICGCFVVPGLIYFAWRAHYFHAWLPLPFLVKSDVQRVAGVLVPHSFWQSSKYLLFGALWVWPVVRGHVATRGVRVLWAAIVLVPTLFYWAMRLDQNVGDRFFFYLPLAAALLLALHWPHLSDARKQMAALTGLAAALLLLLGPLLREVRSFRDYQFRTVQSFAAGLSRLPARGSLLTTEAGFLAYGSGWRAYDAWGLNTASFAQRLIQPSDVVALRPDLIVLHPDPEESCIPREDWASSYAGRAWQHMTRNMVLGARDVGGYELWLLPYGSRSYQARRHWTPATGDRECFLLHSDSPDFPGMVALLRKEGAVGPPMSIAQESRRR